MTENEQPKYSPSPWARGLMYTLCAFGALIYGHVSGERVLDTPIKWIGLGSVAILAGVGLALLQSWARHASERDRAANLSRDKR